MKKMFRLGLYLFFST